jgi:hypothetical protein
MSEVVLNVSFVVKEINRVILACKALDMEILRPLGD